MIEQLSEEVCANHGCKNKAGNRTKLLNGLNIGGWKAHRTKEGNYETGYICKRCGSDSVPNTQRLALYQQTQHYATPQPRSYNAVTNKTIQHKRDWSNLVKLTKDNDKKQNNKMPEWNQVLDRMAKKKKVEE